MQHGEYDLTGFEEDDVDAGVDAGGPNVAPGAMDVVVPGPEAEEAVVEEEEEEAAADDAAAVAAEAAAAEAAGVHEARTHDTQVSASAFRPRSYYPMYDP